MEITEADRPTLEALFQLYVYDFSTIVGVDVGDDGRFAIGDRIDEQPRRQSFLVRVDGKLAGFAIVKRQSRFTGDERVTDLEQFFVLRRYRRQRVGERMLAWLLDRFPGPWEIRVDGRNVDGIAFWRRVLPGWSEEQMDDDRWRGPVFRP